MNLFGFLDESAIESFIKNKSCDEIKSIFSKYKTDEYPYVLLAYKVEYYDDIISAYRYPFDPASEDVITLKVSYDYILAFSKLVVKRKIANDGIQIIFLEQVENTWQIVGYVNRYDISRKKYTYKGELFKSEHYLYEYQDHYWSWRTYKNGCYHINVKGSSAEYVKISKEQFDTFLKNRKILPKCEHCGFKHKISNKE